MQTNAAWHQLETCCQTLYARGLQARTWQALLGDSATPEMIDKIFSGESDDEDMGQLGEGMVWLLGEQRWAVRSV